MMKVLTRGFLSALMLVVASMDMYAADPFKTAKQAIKTGKNLDAAEQELVAYTAVESTAPSMRARAFNVAAQVAQKIYAVENEKNYLRKPFDTVRYFSALGRVYKHTLKCDSVDAMPDETGKVRNAYRKENRSTRERLRNNLLQGGKWMMQKRRYAEAADLFNVYCTADGDLLEKDTQRAQIALWLSKCAYANGDMPLTLSYIDGALQAGKDVPVLLEYKSRAQLAVADTAGWKATLCRGTTECPGHTYFFVSLNARLRQDGNLDEALRWSKHVVDVCPDTLAYCQALAQNLYDLKRSDDCIAACDRVLALNPSQPDAWLYKGVSWMRRAETLEASENYNPKSDRKRLAELYTEAKSALEKYRSLRKEDHTNWAPLLYKVYYTLNMGRELDDVEQYIRGTK